MSLPGWSSPLLDPVDPQWLERDARLCVHGDVFGAQRLLADFAFALCARWPSVTYLGPRPLCVDGLHVEQLHAPVPRRCLIDAIGRPGPTVIDARALIDADDLLGWCRRLQDAPVLVGGPADIRRATHSVVVRRRVDHWEATFRTSGSSMVAQCAYSRRARPTHTLADALHRLRVVQ